MNNDLNMDTAVLFFITGTLVAYLGGLYGGFEVSILLIVSGILMKFYGLFFIFPELFQKNRYKRKDDKK